jgi:ankyrin repeat protein
VVDGSIARAAREIAASARTGEAAGLVRVAVCIGGPARVWQCARRRRRSGGGDKFDQPQRATWPEGEGGGGGMAALSSKSADHALERAIVADDAAAVAAAIASGASVNGNMIYRPIYRAAERGKLAAFRALLAAGADAATLFGGHSIVWAALEGGNATLIRDAIAAREAAAPQLPPLHVAAAADDDGAAVAAVLASGRSEDVNAVAGEADGGVTAVHVAAACGYVGAIRALAAAGSRVDVADGSGRQAMHQAAGSGHVEAIRALAELGGRVDAANSIGQQPMHVAAARGLLDAIGALADLGSHVDATDERSWQPMHMAAWSGHVEAIRALAALGGRVDAANSIGQQPIHGAAAGGHVGAIRVLVQLGSRLAVVDEMGRQPMHHAAEGGHAVAIRMLVELGGRLAVIDGRGRQPMHHATEHGHEHTIRVLAELGGRVDAADGSGRQPMHIAATLGGVSMIRVLVELGGRVDAADGSGRQPIHMAAECGHVDVIRALAELGGRVDAADKSGRQPMHVAAGGGHVGAIRALVELGGRVDAADGRGQQPMRIAMDRRDLQTMLAMAELGASLACTDEHSRTPLHYALHPGYRSPPIDLALRFIAAGAPTSARDSAGATPLHLAAAIPSKPVVLALLAAGANPTIQDNEGRYAIQRVPNTAAAPIAGDPVKEAIVDALQSAMHAVFAARGAGSLPAWLGTLRGSVRRLLLPTTAEEAITPAQIAAATVDPAAVTWDRGADGQLVRLGGGAFGSVYAGRLRLAGGGVADVALKQVLVAAPSAAGGAASTTAEQQDGAFWREVVVHRGCSSHAGIVRCHGGFVRDREGVRERVMVVDRCVGSLADALHGRVVDAATQRRDPATARAVTPAQRLMWARQLVAALAYLHGRDIVHGDVKSENVLLDGDGNVRVSDLGGAALRREENAAAADAAHMGERGSPAYMCPALGLGRTPLGKASDVYSCGVLVWEVLSGVSLWSRGEAAGVASAAQLYGAVAEGARPGSGTELCGLAPRGVGDWIAAMWHPHPRMRPPLEDVAEALRVLSGGEERLPRRRRDAGWVESFGVSAVAGARTRLAAGLVAPVVGAAAALPAPAAVPPWPVVHDPAVIAAALGPMRPGELAFGGTRDGSS